MQPNSEGQLASKAVLTNWDEHAQSHRLPSNRVCEVVVGRTGMHTETALPQQAPLHTAA